MFKLNFSWQETIDIIRRYQIRKNKLKKKQKNSDLSKQNFNKKRSNSNHLFKSDADYDIQVFNLNFLINKFYFIKNFYRNLTKIKEIY